MSVKNIEIQDSEGNIFYPHTDSSVVKSGNTTVSEELKAVNSRIDNIKIADGTITTKGIVKLNNATNSTSQTEASTPLAVKTAMDRANEAFLSASNGKNYIAGKVGNVTGGNTFTQIGDEIQTDKNIIASNLNNKGISANGNEILSTLANKINNISIESLGGIKGTKGSFNSPSNYVTGTINLSFRPSIVFIWCNYYTGTRKNICFMIDNQPTAEYNGTFEFKSERTGYREATFNKLTAPDSSETSKYSWVIPFNNGFNYRLYINPGNASNRIDWLAIQ